MYTCCAFCQALRDGQLRTMDAADLVPGDVILIRLGDVVPADVKLLGDEEEAAEDETPMQVSSRPS
jgi:H+-transporting ATPase